MPHVRQHLDRVGLSETETRVLLRKLRKPQHRDELRNAVREEIARMDPVRDKDQIERMREWTKRSLSR